MLDFGLFSKLSLLVLNFILTSKLGNNLQHSGIDDCAITSNQSSTKMGSTTGLLSLPNELLILLPNYLHDIEDYANLSCTCIALRYAMNAATPRQLLKLAADASRTFFRPSPHFLVTATARELGQWARKSAANEIELATKLEDGLDGLLELAIQHCGLTMQRIRELYEMRFSLINPISDIIDRCVGTQWYTTENFWNGGVSDAYTIDANPSASFFHLAIYGELFGPEFETYLQQNTHTRQLKVETRLEFVKYCIPDFATNKCQNSARDVTLPDGTMDPRRAVKTTGPYSLTKEKLSILDNNIGLTWVLKSSRWKPYWRDMRAKVGPDFEELQDYWYHTEGDWRQRLWEACMVTQGLRGFEMMKPEMRDAWVDTVRGWRERIERLSTEPVEVKVGTTFTHQYPWLAGDLRILATGFLLGT
jgi:hypothetical protein